ncbi:MAG: hypothetical protein HFH26_02640 [Clostridiaceae bacterium]|nr:hypothetical protein [Clostridiaceae bacterium]
MHLKKDFRQLCSLFLCGSAGYAALELLWRQRTHWTMALTGGTVFVGLAKTAERLRGASLPKRCAAGSVLITTAELIVGTTVNLHYHMRVWDYSREKLNFKGQICAKYAALWYLLSAPAMALAHRLARNS